MKPLSHESLGVGRERPEDSNKVKNNFKRSVAPATIVLCGQIALTLLAQSRWDGSGPQCIRIGVMEDNFDFGHFLHFRQYKKV